MLIALLLPSSNALRRFASLYPSFMAASLFAAWIRKILWYFSVLCLGASVQDLEILS